MDSSTTESPLDVLSRAATMLQDNAPLPPSYGDNEVDVYSASSIQNSDAISCNPVNSFRNSATSLTNLTGQEIILDHYQRQGMSSDVFGPTIINNPSFVLPCTSQDVAFNSFYNMGTICHGQGVLAQSSVLDGNQRLNLAASMRRSFNYPNMADEARFHLKCKEMAAAAANGGKWKRERRSRPATATPPAYPLKTAQISQHTEPIDMSTRKIRGSPPSYSQTISAGYINRPPTTTNSPITATNNSPITNNNSVTTAEADTDADADSSMPVIDEHFRRSLGKHYQSVFAPSSANSSSSSSSASSVSSSSASARQRITSNGQTTDDSSSDSADNAGSALSVDEHFAKALGETWLKLQQKEKSASMTNGVSNSHSSSSSSSSTMTITTTTNSPLVLVPSSTPDHALLRVNRIEP